ncbi:MAG: hypothetical protein ACRDRO_00700 [Pseudonocardiaceae bacterium]
MISLGIRKRSDLRDTVSHETVGLMLRGEAVPGWTKLECVVRHLVDIAVRQPDGDVTVGKFHELWLAAVATNHADGTAADPHVATASAPNAIAARVLLDPLPRDTLSAPVQDQPGDLPPRNPNARRADSVSRMNATPGTWYLQSMGDADTHRGDLNRDGTVTAACGSRFRPLPLLAGRVSLPCYPPDPDQICPDCNRHGGAR